MIPGDDLIRMAREAGLHMQNVTDRLGSCTYVGEAPLEKFERFAALVAAAERKACKQVCDEHARMATSADGAEWAESCGAAIAERGAA